MVCSRCGKDDSEVRFYTTIQYGKPYVNPTCNKCRAILNRNRREYVRAAKDFEKQNRKNVIAKNIAKYFKQNY